MNDWKSTVTKRHSDGFVSVAAQCPKCHSLNTWGDREISKSGTVTGKITRHCRACGNREVIQ